MKTIVVLSDTHGNIRGFDKIDTVLRECDYIFHLGDIITDASYLRRTYGDKVVNVFGNCDGITNGDEQIVEVEGVKFLLCHGHDYNVKYTLDRLYSRGLEAEVNVCLYGHTHEALIEEYSNLTIINPGNMTRYSINPTYCYIVVTNGKIIPKIVDVVV